MARVAKVAAKMPLSWPGAGAGDTAKGWAGQVLEVAAKAGSKESLMAA